MEMNCLKFRRPHCRARLTTISSTPNIDCPKCARAINLVEIASAAKERTPTKPRETQLQAPTAAIGPRNKPRRQAWDQFAVLGIPSVASSPSFPTSGSWILSHSKVQFLGSTPRGPEILSFSAGKYGFIWHRGAKCGALWGISMYPSNESTEMAQVSRTR